MDFPDDGVDLSLLADLVTRRLHVPILYDDQIRGKKVVIRVPTPVPESALMGILQSALRLKGLALVDAEQPGWKQVVPAPNLAAVAQPTTGANGNAKVDADAGPVAQAFLLEHADPAKLVELVRPFLTQPGGYVQAEVGQKVLLVSDYPSVVRRAAVLIRELDSASPAVETRFVQVRSADATAVAAAVAQLVANREAFQWGSATGSGVSLTGDERSNQVVVVAPPARMADVVGLIAGLDRAPDLQSRVYRLRAVTPDRVDQLVRSLLDPAALKRDYQASPDRDSQTLVVSATPAVQDRIAGLVRELDVPAPTSANPIQFYKLKNTKAADLLGTISGLLGDATATGTTPAVPGRRGPRGDRHRWRRRAPGGRARARPVRPGGVNAGAGPIGPTAAEPVGRPDRRPRRVVRRGTTSRRCSGTAARRHRTGRRAVGRRRPVGPQPGRDGGGRREHEQRDRRRPPGRSRPTYADLIRRLDQRRPQVQIECTIVTLDTTDDTSPSASTSAAWAGLGTSQLLSLSSFGISSANPVNGVLTPVAGTGGTFALLSPRIADVVITALETTNKARLISAPQLLVNDNGSASSNRSPRSLTP